MPNIKKSTSIIFKHIREENWGRFFKLNYSYNQTQRMKWIHRMINCTMRVFRIHPFSFSYNTLNVVVVAVVIIWSMYHGIYMVKICVWALNASWFLMRHFILLNFYIIHFRYMLSLPLPPHTFHLFNRFSREHLFYPSTHHRRICAIIILEATAAAQWIR